jgi:hypothetical protein
MGTNDKTSGKRRPEGRQVQAVQGSEPGVTPSLSSTRTMVAFRIPTPLHAEITKEALSVSLDLTSFVNRALTGYMHYFGLPAPVVEEALERDREALGLGRFEYFQYVLFRRYEAMSKNGPGFDRPGLEKKAK